MRTFTALLLCAALGVGGVSAEPSAAGMIEEKLAKAEQGDADAQSKLGWMYLKGQGVPQDYAQAAAWYRKAADQGEEMAQFLLGSLYFKALGVPQDYAQAAGWWRKAADQGETMAQFFLGSMYYYGWGVPQDYAHSYMWYNLAAAQDNKQAIEYRDSMTKSLTQSQIEEGQLLTREWLAAHSKQQGGQ